MARSSSGTYLFHIIGKKDNPIYEAEFVFASKKEGTQLGQFIIHAALDVIDETVWTTNNMYLKTVDKFNDLTVSAFVTASQLKLVLLHDSKNDDGIKNFFTDVYELLIKALMNPFCDVDTPIASPVFDARVRQLAKKHFY